MQIVNRGGSGCLFRSIRPLEEQGGLLDCPFVLFSLTLPTKFYILYKYI